MPIEIETKQKVTVLTMQDLLESKYNDGPILERITAIESRLNALETAPEEPPADDPVIVPDPPEEPPVVDPPESSVLLGSIAYRSQEEIDAHSLKPEKLDTGSNENIRYDIEQNAGAIIVSGSISPFNATQIKFAPINTGVLTCAWEYKPSEDWLGNGSDIMFHKMFMIGSWEVPDRRVLETRFQYHTASDGFWKVDTRPYALGTGTGTYGRIEPYTETFIPVDEWAYFTTKVDFTATVPTYTLIVNGTKTYDAVPLPTLIESKKSLDFFDPTWCNTSQGTDKPPIVHGWLRNVSVFWNNQLKGRVKPGK